MGAGQKSGAGPADFARWRWLKVRASAAGSGNGPSQADAGDLKHAKRGADGMMGGPGPRHAVAIAAGGDGRGFYLFGGSRHAETGFRPKVFDDLWWARCSRARALPRNARRFGLLLAF